ncbi:asparaginase-domain-containing protein [Atractiella rhizophila]|nr:asparaginase-domain-containing protein [Atractiella rhizophila]
MSGRNFTVSSDAVNFRQHADAPPTGRHIDQSQILVLYTGGTIGMVKGEGGYTPIRGYLLENLKSQSRFHDPMGDSIMEHSHSVDSYRSWSASNSEVQSPSSDDVKWANAFSKQQLSSRLAKLGHTVLVHTQNGDLQLPYLITPKSSQGRRTKYCILEYDPLIDSSEVELADWIRIAKDIEANYTNFDGFVILHGTDTMAYSASALSFLLEDLGKTVIITGAQIPLSDLRNDAVENLLGALTIAGRYLLPEVTLYFNDALYRGNRCTKQSSVDFDAFTSFNFPPLVKVGINIQVEWDLVLKPTAIKGFRAHKDYNPNVASLRLFPGISAATVRAFLAPPLQGLVLQTFGAGNAPRRKDLRDALKEAADRGVVIVNITQCHQGSVSDIYETGRALKEIGVIPGEDMTVEAALAKLGYLLSKPNLTKDQIRALIPRSLRGELTPPVETVRFSAETQDQRIDRLLSHLLACSSLDPTDLQASDSLNQTVGSSTRVSNEQVSAAERELLPVLLGQAAGRSDGTLERLIRDYVDPPSSPPPSLTLAVGGTVSTGSRRPTSMTSLTANANFSLLNTPCNAIDQTGLHIASSAGILSNVTLLLESSASVHLRDKNGHTPLFLAATLGHEDVVKALVKAGAHLGDGEISRGEVGLEIWRREVERDEDGLRVFRETGVDFEEAKAACRRFVRMDS